MKLNRNLIVVDLETTGIWLEKDRIIEIAMIKCTVEGKRELYHKRVNPGIPIPPVISKLVGITNEDVKDAPKFKEIAKEVMAFIGEADFAGFNVDRFDLPMLRRELSDAGETVQWYSAKVFDAQKVFHLNEKRDLTAAYKFYCNKDLDNAHSAMNDTEATLEILEAQIKQYGEGDTSPESLSRFEYESNAEFYDPDRKFRWWNGKLYMMFGKYARRYALQDIVKKDRDYCEWILSADFSDEVKDLMAKALQGKFPSPSDEKQKELF